MRISLVKYTVTTKHCTISDKVSYIIGRDVEKLSRFLGMFDPFLHLTIILDKEHQRPVRSTNRTIRKVKTKSPTYFETMFSLHLPKKTLVVHTKAERDEIAIREGFVRLFRQLRHYKAAHVPSHTDYKDHTSIRRVRLY